MSRANRSSAVMQQRDPSLDKVDDFPTPMWATRAVIEWLRGAGRDLSADTVREPCANRGYMVAALDEGCASVVASDLMDYGVGFPVVDYLAGPVPELVDWTFINPPFAYAQEFIDRARRSSRKGVAVFCRLAFAEGATRHRELFSVTPPTFVLPFSERVVIHRSKMRRAGERYWDAKANKGKGGWRNASTATAYCWMIWLSEDVPLRPALDWIGPCRERLERPGDYEVRGNV